MSVRVALVRMAETALIISVMYVCVVFSDPCVCGLDTMISPYKLTFGKSKTVLFYPWIFCT